MEISVVGLYGGMHSATLLHVAAGTALVAVAALALYLVALAYQQHYRAATMSGAHPGASQPLSLPAGPARGEEGSSSPPPASPSSMASSAGSPAGGAAEQKIVEEPGPSAQWSSRFEGVKELPLDHEERKAFIEELLGWLVVDSVKEDLECTDLGKVIGRVEHYVSQLLKGQPELFFQGPHVTEDEEGRSVIRVKADGNCGYYAFAGRLLMMKDALAGALNELPEDFTELAHALRQKAAQLAQGELDESARFVFLPIAVEAWVEKNLRDYVFNTVSYKASAALTYDSTADVNAPKRAFAELTNSLGFQEEQQLEVSATLKPILDSLLLNSLSADGIDRIAAVGVSPNIVAQVMEKYPEHFNALYIRQIAKNGFWAGPFELYLLAKDFQVPIRIHMPDQVIVLNEEAAQADRPWVEIIHNGRDHYDMIAP